MYVRSRRSKYGRLARCPALPSPTEEVEEPAPQSVSGSIEEPRGSTDGSEIKQDTPNAYAAIKDYITCYTTNDNEKAMDVLDALKCAAKNCNSVDWLHALDEVFSQQNDMSACLKWVQEILYDLCDYNRDDIWILAIILLLDRSINLDKTNEEMHTLLSHLAVTKLDLCGQNAIEISAYKEKTTKPIDWTRIDEIIQSHDSWSGLQVFDGVEEIGGVEVVQGASMF